MRRVRFSWISPLYVKTAMLHLDKSGACAYSVGFPYKQYIDLIIGSSLLFRRPKKFTILIDEPKEKEQIIPGIRSEIALDTPCPIIVGDKLHLYYAVMDRADKIWRTALTIFSLNDFYE
ncbi:MAG: hypothetical protein QXR44_06690 [Thermoproteota archaeon]